MSKRKKNKKQSTGAAENYAAFLNGFTNRELLQIMAGNASPELMQRFKSVPIPRSYLTIETRGDVEKIKAYAQAYLKTLPDKKLDSREPLGKVEL